MICIICGEETITVKQIELYPFGSEGCPLCLACRIKVGEFITKLKLEEMDKKKNKVLASKWFSETGEFIGHIPPKVVAQCSHSGNCESDIKYWMEHCTFNVPDNLARNYLKSYGCWVDLDTCSYDTLKERVFWLACCSIKEEGKWFGLVE
jgi:hypothetical protein